MNKPEMNLDWNFTTADYQAAINTYAVNGEIGLMESGRDCDGVEYGGGSPSIVEATQEAMESFMNDKAEWADGPFTLRICGPHDTEKSYSHDRTMEAFENGHPYSI